MRSDQTRRARECVFRRSVDNQITYLLAAHDYVLPIAASMLILRPSPSLMCVSPHQLPTTVNPQESFCFAQKLVVTLQ